MIDLYFTENDQRIHVVDRAAIIKYNLPMSLAEEKFFKINDDLYVSNHLTFAAMAEFVLGDITFDYATPSSFWNSRPDWRDCVWLYDLGDYFGKPYNVKATFKELVRQLVDQAVHTDSSVGAL